MSLVVLVRRYQIVLNMLVALALILLFLSWLVNLLVTSLRKISDSFDLLSHKLRLRFASISHLLLVVLFTRHHN